MMDSGLLKRKFEIFIFCLLFLIEIFSNCISYLYLKYFPQIVCSSEFLQIVQTLCFVTNPLLMIADKERFLSWFVYFSAKYQCMSISYIWFIISKNIQNRKQKTENIYMVHNQQNKSDTENRKRKS